VVALTPAAKYAGFRRKMLDLPQKLLRSAYPPITHSGAF
jgi:hypothetical protein